MYSAPVQIAVCVMRRNVTRSKAVILLNQSGVVPEWKRPEFVGGELVEGRRSINPHVVRRNFFVNLQSQNTPIRWCA